MGQPPPTEVTSSASAWFVRALLGRERESSAGGGVLEQLGPLAFAGPRVRLGGRLGVGVGGGVNERSGGAVAGRLGGVGEGVLEVR